MAGCRWTAAGIGAMAAAGRLVGLARLDRRRTRAPPESALRRRDAPWARRTAGAKRCCRWRWTALPRWDRRPTGRPSATCPGLEPAPSLVPAVPWLTLYDLTGAGPIQTRGRGAPLAQRLFVEILTVVPRAWCCPAIRRRWPAA